VTPLPARASIGRPPRGYPTHLQPGGCQARSSRNHRRAAWSRKQNVGLPPGLSKTPSPSTR
jgi:hypothetical protein